MNKKSQDEMITEEIQNLFVETFEKVQGFYLDKETSLFERLNTISAEAASKTARGSDSTIAGHVEHIRFFMETIIGYNSGDIEGKTDWNKSWAVKTVDEQEWDTLKKELEKTYSLVRKNISGITYWKDEDDFSGILSILVHTAFHMGALWKMMEQTA